MLEGLEVEKGGRGGKGLEEDRFIGYPVKLERWLMEGSYDRVWGATKREGVPGEEFGVFSEVGFGGSSRWCRSLAWGCVCLCLLTVWVTR